MLRYGFLFSFVFLLSMATNAQDETDTANGTPFFELGFAVGHTTGSGLSFRFWPSRFGVQTTFAYLENENQSLGKPDIRISSGLSFLYRLVEGDVTNLYLYQGNHFFSHRYPGSPPLGRPNSPIDMKTVRRLNNGLGIGVEFLIADRIDFTLMTGYGAFTEFFEGSYESTRFKVTGEAGLYYRF
jgi:hypothetical protein